MDNAPLAVIGFGAIATAASLAASRGAWRAKAKQGTRWPLVTFWVTVTAYMSFFTLLRTAYWLDVEALVPLFYLQTIAGAATIVSLGYIMCGVIIGPRAARLGMEVLGAVAVMIVTIIFTLGVTAARTSRWGVEMLPVSDVARSAIGIVYVALPVAMAVLAVYFSWRSADGVLDKRLTLFAISVGLMFVPNAIKYVVFVSGPVGVALAAVMAGGALIGARAYASA